MASKKKKETAKEAEKETEKAEKNEKSETEAYRLKQAKIEKELAKEMKELSKQIQRLKKLEFVKILKHPVKFLWYMFLKGLMIGFGSILGASVLVALLLTVLSRISFVPIVGDFVEDIIVQIEDTSSIEAPQQQDQPPVRQNQSVEEPAEQTVE